VKELKSGSLEAFERLDQALTRPLIDFLCFTMNVPEADAEELASDTLLVVSSHINKFEHGGKAKLTTWIFEIAKNKAIDFHRKPSLDTVAIDEGFPDCEPPGACAGRNNSYRYWLDKELAALSEEDRTLLLWRAKDIPYKQIGEWLGISEGAARTRHSRLYAQLEKAANEAKTEKRASYNG
jgi:RNA polymerase sigma-70 factor, ECF subfamily